MRMKKIILFFCFVFLPLQAHAECADATCYFDTGHGYYMQEDYAQAENWLVKAAEAGHGDAQVRLGFLYGENHFDGVKHNLEKAQYWLTKAAEQNADGGKFRLGNFYAHYIKPPDYQKAAYWLKKSADENNNPSAQYDLGRLYMSDNLGEPDLDQSAKYLVMAAENDLKQAQITLVSLYEDQKEYAKALKWVDVLANGRNGAIYWKNKATELKSK